MGFILLLMGLCIYTVAWVGLSGKGSGAGFELTLIWVPLAYVLLLPGSILVLRDFRRTSPLVVMITGAILIVFDHFFSVTLETGNTSGYSGIGAAVNFVVGLIGIPLVFIGFWLIIEGFIRLVKQRWSEQPAQRTTSRGALTVSLIMLVSLLVVDASLTFWISSHPGVWSY